MSSDAEGEAAPPSDPSVAPPAAAAVEVEPEELVALRAKLRDAEKPTHLGLRTLLFLVTLGAFVAAMRDAGPLVIAVVVGVLLLHEGGHFAAMKWLGYENLKVFFVPFLGAAVSGRARRPGGWRAGVVSLAGPVPGIVLGALLALTEPTGLLRVVVVTLLFINGLNLLPFQPLDGGRLLSNVLFSRHKLLEQAFTVVGALGLVMTPGLLPDLPGVWAGLMVGSLFHRSRMLEARTQLQQLELAWDGPTSELPTASLDALHRAARRVEAGGLTTERSRISNLTNLHDEVAAQPASRPHAVLLFAAWALAGGLAWSTLQHVKHPPEQWRTVSDPGLTWSASFPAATETTVAPTPPGLKSLSTTTARFDGREFSVVHAVLLETPADLDQAPDDANARFDAMVADGERRGMVVVSQLPRELDRRPARDLVFKLPGSTELMWVRYLAFKKDVLVLATTSQAPAARDRFFDSVRVLAPP